MFRKVISYLTVTVMALIAALNYEIFILPNSFAPSGVNGICTIIMKIFGINIGYLSIIINLPLALVVYFKVGRSVAKRSLVYVLVFSILLVAFEKVNLPLHYFTDNGTSKILGPLTAGVVMGCIYSILLRMGAYTGGTDFVALIIHNKHPERSVFYITFIINAVVAVSSFVVFDYKIEPVLLCLMYSFAASTIADKALKIQRSAVRFEIITNYGEEISSDIINVLHHSTTMLDSKGAYSNEDKKVLICVVNKSQIAVVFDIISKYPGSFAVMNTVSEVVGNFRKLQKNGKPDDGIFDSGNSKL